MAYDLLHYICPPNGKQYRLFGLGDENCQCVQAADGWIEFRKNKNMEEFYATDSVIGRGADTSSLSHDGVHADGQFYVQYTKDPAGNLSYGAAWAKRAMDVGESYHRNVHVVVYNADGSPSNEYDEASDLVVNAHHDSLTFAQSGITIQDVLELQWGGQETYYYAKDYGLVGWKNLVNPQASFVGVLSANIMDPFPHARPRPSVAAPPAAAVEIPPVAPADYPAGTNPQPMQVNLPAGIWIHAAPGTSTPRVRLLVHQAPVTVYAQPVVPAEGYDWQRVASAEGDQGWSAAVVDGNPTFVPVEAPPAHEEPSGAFRLAYPVAPPAHIAQPFGVNWTGIDDFYTQHGLPAHEGVDFDGSLGDPISAAADGTILAIAIPGQDGVDANHPYGLHIKIRHTAGAQVYETDYCHLSMIAVGLTRNHPVTTGQNIGAMGNSGNVVNHEVHLHFMLRKQGATAAGETQRLGDGTEVVYINDIVDPTPYFGS